MLPKIRDVIEAGKAYLLSKITNGLCLEFHQARHGPSYAWTTACVGSTLSEFNAVPDELLEALLELQDCGGWSYNPLVPPDADSTLRVIQFLHKISFTDKVKLSNAEEFVLSLQQPDGGFATFHKQSVEKMGYQQPAGWSISHPCVTALAVGQLTSDVSIKKAHNYLRQHLKRIGPVSYWWRTPFYILYEMGRIQKIDLVETDAVDISLRLLLEAKLHIANKKLVRKLIRLQRESSYFPPSQQFRVPRPHQALDDLTGTERILIDQQGIFSTCAAIVALSRQSKL